MMTSELIDKLQKLVDKNGDVVVHIYDAYKDKTMKEICSSCVFFDDETKDICISIYDER